MVPAGFQDVSIAASFNHAYALVCRLSVICVGGAALRHRLLLFRDRTGLCHGTDAWTLLLSQCV